MSLAMDDELSGFPFVFAGIEGSCFDHLVDFSVEIGMVGVGFMCPIVFPEECAGIAVFGGVEEGCDIVQWHIIGVDEDAFFKRCFDEGEGFDLEAAEWDVGVLLSEVETADIVLF